MIPKNFLIVSALFFLIVPISVFAASFDSNVSPTTLDAGSNLLVNFTVENNDVAIVKVNFTLPSGFSYYGGYSSTSSDGTFSPTPMPSWYNRTTSNIIAISGEQYFWFKVSTPSSGTFPNSFDFTVSTTDTTGTVGSENVSVTVTDQSAPKWSSNSSSPSPPSAYVLNRSYIFNITWIDNVALEGVTFEWDETTNYTNISAIPVVNLSSGRYSITLTDLLQDNYTYKWYADDWNDAENSTELVAFNVTRANNPINMYFNGNLNQGLTLNDGETINVTVTGLNVNIYKNGTLVTNPFEDVLPIGYYEFKANSSGNRNYTANVTGATYHLDVVYPAPKYTMSTSISSTWSSNYFASFNVTWTDDNDPNGFSAALIELNHTGTSTNYSMSRMSGTNTSTYQLNVTQPMGLRWKIYANNSFDSWNSTPLTDNMIGKISPTFLFNVTPGWNVIRGTKTTVSCYSSQVSVNVYRVGVLVSNPDIQTLGRGAYIYSCNSTTTTNFSAKSETKLLSVFKYLANISFTQAENVVPVLWNSSNSTVIIVKNTGNTSYLVSFTIENITSEWYTINSTEADIGIGEKAAFLVNFTVDDSAEIKDYVGVYKSTTTNSTISYNFILRVLPKEDSYSSIENTVAVYRVNMTKIWNLINETKSRQSDINLTSAEQIITEAKEKIELAESYITSGDYFNAYQLLDGIKSLIASAETELETTKTITSIDITKTKLAPWMVWGLIAIGIIVAIVLIYLLWPTSGYSPKTGKYVYKTSKQRSVEKLSDAKEKIKDKVSKQPSYKPKRSLVSKILPKLIPRKQEEIDITSLTETKPPEDSKKKKKLMKPEILMMPKTESEESKVKRGGKLKEKVSDNISKLKNLIKRPKKQKGNDESSNDYIEIKDEE